MGGSTSSLREEEIAQYEATLKIDRSEILAQKALFDKNSPNGTLTRAEFVFQLKQYKGGTTQFWKTVFHFFDKNRDGSINFHEYLIALTCVINATSKERAQFIFRLFDKNEDDVLTKLEWRIVVLSLSKIQQATKWKESNFVETEMDKLFRKLKGDHPKGITETSLVESCESLPELNQLLTGWADEDVFFVQGRIRYKAMTNALSILGKLFEGVSLPRFLKGMILLRRKRSLLPKRDTSNKPVPSQDVLQEGLHYLIYALCAYGCDLGSVMNDDLFGPPIKKALDLLTDEQFILDHCKIDSEDLIFTDWSKDNSQPAHFIAVDHKKKSIVLSIRGTMTIDDVVTDLVATDEPFLDGKGHSGIAQSSFWFAETHRAKLIDLANRHSGYDIVITGHSLGAGIAIMVGLTLQREGLPVKVHAFAPPPVVSQDLATSCASFTSWTVNHDIVPRLSLVALNKMKDNFRDVIQEHNLGSFFPSVMAHNTFEDKKEGEEQVEDHLQLLRKVQNQNYVPLFIPGVIYNFERMLQTPKWKVYQEEDRSHYDSIYLSKLMFKDHTSLAYYSAFKALVKP